MNKKQYELIKKSVKEFNLYRENDPSAIVDLRGADLRGADLRGANLRGANLTDANLRSADLEYANLNGANLNGADLCSADLYCANLRNANLNGADLYGADLYGANLTDADLKPIWLDLDKVLEPNFLEINHLWRTLRNGKIDGSSYTGECSCLSGTLAHGKKSELPESIVDTRDFLRPIERFFLRIGVGDTPDNSWDCKQIEKQIIRFIKENNLLENPSFQIDEDLKGLVSRGN